MELLSIFFAASISVVNPTPGYSLHHHPHKAIVATAAGINVSTTDPLYIACEDPTKYPALSCPGVGGGGGGQ